jgi:superfamily I DNA and RNA helicase
MAIEIAPQEGTLRPGSPEKLLVAFLRTQQKRLELEDARVYCGFPLYHDEDGQIIETDVLLISRVHGVVAFSVVDAGRDPSKADIKLADERLDRVVAMLHSRLIRSQHLRVSKTKLTVDINYALYAPGATTKSEAESSLLRSDAEISQFLADRRGDPMEEQAFRRLVATIQGAGSVSRPKVRQATNNAESKGAQATAVENAIILLDNEQTPAGMAQLNGPQRLRGIAGSGKTVVLAMRAAILHLRYPSARILYTFYTKALIQHITRLITRFYRQFADTDPDWDRVQVLHGWGGASQEGVYSLTCRQLRIGTMSFREASRLSPENPFEYLCAELLKYKELEPRYDYILIDEGQDFPPSFLRLCRKLVVDDRFLWAYDEFQNIFQITAPSLETAFGKSKDGGPRLKLRADTVLHRCYRNPREVLVCAHALGLGVYGKGHQIQVLESEEHWNYIGYQLRSGQLKSGSDVVIERPPETAPLGAEIHGGIGEMVKMSVFDDAEKEVRWVVESVLADIEDGLRPDDILIVTVDDRHAKDYLQEIGRRLALKKIATNNIHADPMSFREFYHKDQVTLATVHKAKGNEAFMVYVVGTDACFPATWRDRNKLFTAMTRAKAWVRMSGVGEAGKECAREVQLATENYPYLRFKYPTESQMRIIKRDLAEPEAKHLRAEKLMEQALSELSFDEIERMLAKRKVMADKTIRMRKHKDDKGE